MMEDTMARRRWKLALFTALLGAALVACGGGKPASNGSSPAPVVRPSSTASLTIVSPTPGQLIKGTTLHVKLQLMGGTVVRQTSTNLTPDHGHIHLSVDNKVISILAGLEQDIKNLTTGQHLLTAEFVAVDHGIFNPRVIQTVTFRVS
jgi:hypothetical protein